MRSTSSDQTPKLTGVCSGFVSGSAAKEVKFWEWSIIGQQPDQARQLTINNTRTLEMTDDVLCVRISPNGLSPGCPGRPFVVMPCFTCGKDLNELFITA